MSRGLNLPERSRTQLVSRIRPNRLGPPSSGRGQSSVAYRKRRVRLRCGSRRERQPSGVLAGKIHRRPRVPHIRAANYSSDCSSNPCAGSCRRGTFLVRGRDELCDSRVCCCGSEPLSKSKLAYDEILHALRSRQLEPHRSILGFPENLEPKERTALPLQIDPLNQLIGGKVLIVYSKRIPVRKLASFSYCMQERFNKLSVVSSLLGGNSVNVAAKTARRGTRLLLCCYVVAHKHPTCH